MRNTSLKDRAYHRMRRKLFTRELEAGQMVSLRKLVDIVGVPIAPVREAVSRLEAERLIRVHPQRGIQIIEASIEFVREAFQLRSILEGEGIARLCETIAPAEIERLEAATRKVLADCDAGVPADELAKTTMAADEMLHQQIIGALNNHTISDIYELNRDRLRLIKPKMGLPYGGLSRPAMNEHLEVIAALRQKAPEKARAALQNHLTASFSRHVQF